MQKYMFITERSLILSIEDVTNKARAAGLINLPEMICYNIARHQNPSHLSTDQAERYIETMKGLIGVYHVQKAMKS